MAGAATKTDPNKNIFSKDRIEVFDCDDYINQISEATKYNESLRNQIDDINSKIESCLLLLNLKNKDEIDNNFINTKLKTYPLTDSNILHNFSKLQEIVSIHKLFGLECHSLTKNRFNFIIHCYEDNYPTLPCKVIKIEEIEGTDQFKMRPKEISYHFKCDEKLKTTMYQSSRSDMIKCFQETQSSIFDVVHFDNIYHKLLRHSSVSYSIFCQRTMEGISLVLPLDWKGDHLSKTIQNLNSILPENMTIILTPPTHATDYKWTAEVYTHSEKDAVLPQYVTTHMSSFMKNVKDKDIVESVDLLMKQFNLKTLPSSSSTDVEQSSDNVDFEMFR